MKVTGSKIESFDVLNKVVEDFFETNPEKEWIPIKEIMSEMVRNQVFRKDEKKGLPFRKVLRALDKSNELDKIPRIHAERKEDIVYWYLVREGASFKPKESSNRPPQNPNTKQERSTNDENYLVDLCDELLKKVASRQHTFDRLLGDYHKDGIKQTKLPLDAYYVDLKLVLEFLNSEDSLNLKPHQAEKITVSGVTRAEQRKLYQKRKQAYLSDEGLDLIEINYSDFKLNEESKLLRDKESDLIVLSKALKEFLVN